MSPERIADELASRCLALIVFDQHCRESPPDESGVQTELHAVAMEVERGGLPSASIIEKVLTGLFDRYDPEHARRLHEGFLAAFSVESPPVPADPCT